MNEPIVSSNWDEGPRDILADLRAARDQMLREASLPPRPLFGTIPVSRARLQWLRDGGWVDDQGNLTAKAAERLGVIQAVRFGLIEGVDEMDSFKLQEFGALDFDEAARAGRNLGPRLWLTAPDLRSRHDNCRCVILDNSRRLAGIQFAEPQKRCLAVFLLILAILVFATAFAMGADVKSFGAVGDGVADDTVAIQAAADDCKAKLRAIQPTGGSYMGSSPELFFPAGKYKVSGPIDFSGYQTIRGEDSIVVATDPAADVFRFNGCYRNLIEKMQFIGGGRQIAFANANVDMTKLTIRDCNFQGWTTAAVTAEGTGPDLHLSATLLIQTSNFDGGTMLITRADTTQVTDCRHQFRGPTIVEGTASIQNKWTGGVLGLSNFTGTPVMPVVEGKTTIGHWVENCGSVVAERCRFGGEFAGIPVIHDRGGPNLANPWMGRKIVLVDSQVSSGRDIWPESAPITLFGLPQCIRVVGCSGLVSNAIPVIRLGPGYDCAADVAKVTAAAKTSLSMYSIVIQGNQFFVSQPIPAPLQPFVK